MCKGGFPIKPHAKAEFLGTTVFKDDVGRDVSVPGGETLKSDCVSPSEFLFWPLQESRLLESKASSCVSFLYTYLVPPLLCHTWSNTKQFLEVMQELAPFSWTPNIVRNFEEEV